MGTKENANERNKKSLKLPYKSRLGNNDAKWGYLFILPALLLFLVFTAYPLISAFTISFQKYRPMGSVFVGFENFSILFLVNCFGRRFGTHSFIQ